jgi:hypothetical protein
MSRQRFACSYFLSSLFVVSITVTSKPERPATSLNWISREFAALVYSVLLNVDKNVLKMTETLWKNSLLIAKAV